MALIHGKDFKEGLKMYNDNYFKYVKKLNEDYELERKSKELQNDSKLNCIIIERLK